MFFSQFSTGVVGFIRGLNWLRTHKRYGLLLFAPILGALLLATAGLGVMVRYRDLLLHAAGLTLTGGEGMWGMLSSYLLLGFLLIVIAIVAMLLFVMFTNVLAVPLYDYVSIAVEEDMGGASHAITWWEALMLIGEELKKLLFTVLCTSLIFFIPIANVFSPLIAAFFAGWAVYDLPLARRGWTFRRRLRFVCRHPGRVIGLGLWLLIPFLQFVIMPLAVVGGTILAVEDLKRRPKS